MGLGLIKSSYSPSRKKRKTNLWRDGKHWGGVAVNKVLLLTKREGKVKKKSVARVERVGWGLG